MGFARGSVVVPLKGRMPLLQVLKRNPLASVPHIAPFGCVRVVRVEIFLDVTASIEAFSFGVRSKYSILASRLQSCGVSIIEVKRVCMANS